MNTNEEKAKEIAKLCEHCIEQDGNPCPGCMECEARGTYFGALDMAEHKDLEFIHYLEEEKSRYIDCFRKAVEANDKENAIRSDEVISELDKIINSFKQ